MLYAIAVGSRGVVSCVLIPDTKLTDSNDKILIILNDGWPRGYINKSWLFIYLSVMCFELENKLNKKITVARTDKRSTC